MQEPIDANNANRRTPYEKPTAVNLTIEQAKLKLLGCAMRGDQDVKDFVELIFTEDPQKMPAKTRSSGPDNIKKLA